MAGILQPKLLHSVEMALSNMVKTVRQVLPYGQHAKGLAIAVAHSDALLDVFMIQVAALELPNVQTYRSIGVPEDAKTWCCFYRPKE